MLVPPQPSTDTSSAAAIELPERTLTKPYLPTYLLLLLSSLVPYLQVYTILRLALAGLEEVRSRQGNVAGGITEETRFPERSARQLLEAIFGERNTPLTKIEFSRIILRHRKLVDCLIPGFELIPQVRMPLDTPPLTLHLALQLSYPSELLFSLLVLFSLLFSSSSSPLPTYSSSSSSSLNPPLLLLLPLPPCLLCPPPPTSSSFSSSSSSCPPPHLLLFLLLLFLVLVPFVISLSPSSSFPVSPTPSPASSSAQPPPLSCQSRCQWRCPLQLLLLLPACQ